LHRGRAGRVAPPGGAGGGRGGAGGDPHLRGAGAGRGRGGASGRLAGGGAERRSGEHPPQVALFRRARVRGVLALAIVTLAALPACTGSAAPDHRMNVLVILTDDQSIETLPHSPPIMPFLQSQMEDPSGEWIRFPNAFI